MTAPFSPLRGAFRSVWLLRGCSTLGSQLLAFALGLHLYQVSGSALDLGLLGLVQFVPSLAFALPAGQLVDRFAPGRIAMLAQLLNALAAGALLLPVPAGVSIVLVLYAAALATGATRAFEHPIHTALLPSVVAEGDVSRAVAWVTSVAKIGTMVGPIIGGALYAMAPEVAYGGALGLFIVAALLAATLPGRSEKLAQLSGLRAAFAGLHVIWRDRVLGGAMLLDMLAVLLGGATALLPIYALDVLRVGPVELGFLRAAPGIGAVAVGVWLTYRPVARRVGTVLLSATAVFGALTVAFGLSRSLPLSLVLLAAIGGADMVSIHIRSALVQLRTPAELRGRVGAVNGIFISSSNQIGAFESGLTAYWFGTVPAIVLGGAATVAAVGVIAMLVAPLRRTDDIHTVTSIARQRR
ncbi:MFS transporter [Variovorax ginsengisoli]|uniref:MFS family permease n=1 Tax=Variovorax ginsengisoli TaxID=363844 RepID=A0ABT9SF08_9BURK|nr:MFS transporter [Variovorax ginsengisoli]MDP9901937.1 MFS family permease [Variovorax ginsengisoli]